MNLYEILAVKRPPPQQACGRFTDELVCSWCGSLTVMKNGSRICVKPHFFRRKQNEPSQPALHVNEYWDEGESLI